MSPSPSVEYITVGIYLVLMLVVGTAFTRFNRNTGDFFRSGSRGTWWLVGASMFMTSFSAWTFTGAAGVAYSVGWVIISVYAGHVAAYLLHYLWLARWFRQFRATTAPEVIRARFSERARQFYAWFSVVTVLPIAGLQLYGLAIFCTAVFHFDLQITIVGVGFVALLYAATGGSWAVMATDFVQSIILVPVTLALAFICLQRLGGIDGLMVQMDTAGLDQTFFQPSGRFRADAYTWVWGLALFLRNLQNDLTFHAASRYFHVKDGREAARAALLAGGLMLLGMIAWFIPPITARLLFSEQVVAVGADLPKPAEAAYAVAGMQLLPAGFTGVMVVAMLAATMSSMDSGLNRNAGIIIRDIYPAIAQRLKLSLPMEGTQVHYSRMVTLALGVTIIGCALYFASVKGVGIFEIMTQTSALLMMPLGIPMVVAILIRRAPAWSIFVSIGAGAASSLTSFGSAWLFGSTWNLQTTIFVNLLAGIGGFILTMPFWRWAPQTYREQVDAFFCRMHTPVDFDREVGRPNDPAQLRLLGRFTLVTALLFDFLLLIPNPVNGRFLVALIGCFIAAVGALLLGAASRSAIVPRPISR